MSHDGGPGHGAGRLLLRPRGEITYYPGLAPEPDEAALKRRARNGIQCMDCYSELVANERRADRR